MSRSSETKVYVGGLGEKGDKEELWREFSQFGKLKDVWVAQRPPGFAFVEFEEYLDASDAVRGLDGKRICGSKVRVELSRTRSRGGGRDGGQYGGRGGRDNYRSDRSDTYRRDDYFDRRSPSPRRRSPPRSRYRSPVQSRYRRSRSRSPPRR